MKIKSQPKEPLHYFLLLKSVDEIDNHFTRIDSYVNMYEVFDFFIKLLLFFFECHL